MRAVSNFDVCVNVKKIEHALPKRAKTPATAKPSPGQITHAILKVRIGVESAGGTLCELAAHVFYQAVDVADCLFQLIALLFEPDALTH